MCFLSNFGCKIIFTCSVNFWHQDSNSLLIEEALVTWPLGARGPRTGLRNNTIARRTCVSRNKMPNKKKNNAARNAFYFFMVSLKPQLERQGVVLENGMQSLAEIAGPRWKVLCLQHSFLEATWGHWNFLYFNLNFTKRVYYKIWTITICCYFKFTPVYLPSSILKVVSISFSAREEYHRKARGHLEKQEPLFSISVRSFRHTLVFSLKKISLWSRQKCFFLKLF